MALKSNEVLTDAVILDRIEEKVTENRVFRQAFNQLDASDIDSNKMTITVAQDTLGMPEKVGELEEFPFDEESYGDVEVRFNKWGQTIPISWEAMQDSRIDVVRDNLDKNGRAMARRLNQLAFQELDSNYSQTAGEQGTTGVMEYVDIVDGKTALSRDYYEPDLLIANIQAQHDLLTSDDFIHASDLGDNTLRTGALGQVAGMDVIVSNAGYMSETAPEAYMVDTDYFGYEAIRNEVALNRYMDDARQAEFLQIYSRLGHKVIRPQAAVKVLG